MHFMVLQKGLCLAFLISSFYSRSFVNGEETCTWKEDGSKVCADEEIENHDIWKDPEHKEGTKKPLLRQGFNELELEIFVNFFSQLKDWKPTSDSLAKYRSEHLALAIITTFNEFDEDDDGYLTFTEIETRTKKQDSHEDLSKIEKLTKDYDKEMISIFQYFEFFFKLGDGEVTVPLLQPFLKLKHLPVAGAKKIIQGSVQMFVDADADRDGFLDKDEFTSGMMKTRARVPEGVSDIEIDDEQIRGLFRIVDKDEDKLLSYSEFQATIPDPPKSLEDAMLEIFTTADVNSDGQLTMSEFGTGMKLRAKDLKMDLPSEREIVEVFEKLDVDGDDSLSPTEMYELFKGAKAIKDQKMLEAFNAFDQDKDGSISMDELTAIVKGIEQTSGNKVDPTLFMNMLDQDKDGKVSLEEMQGMLLNSMKMK